MTSAQGNATASIAEFIAFTLSAGIACRLREKTRKADLALRLVQNGSAGITPDDFPAGVRVAGIVHWLRRQGFPIETVREVAPGDPFRAMRARYRTSLTMASVVRESRVP